MPQYAFIWREGLRTASWVGRLVFPRLWLPAGDILSQALWLGPPLGVPRSFAVIVEPVLWRILQHHMILPEPQLKGRLVQGVHNRLIFACLG